MFILVFWRRLIMLDTEILATPSPQITFQIFLKNVITVVISLFFLNTKYAPVNNNPVVTVLSFLLCPTS
jgi:hypothetical protein